MSTLFIIGKGLFFIGPVTFHFYFFAIPAFEKYVEKGVAVEVLDKEAETIQPPAITFCQYKYWFSGWKNASIDLPNFVENYDEHCNAAESKIDIINCIVEKTFNFTDAFPARVLHGELDDIATKDFWITDFTAAINGRCFTLNYTTPVGSDHERWLHF